MPRHTRGTSVHFLIQDAAARAMRLPTLHKMYAHYTGVPRHLAYMQELAKRAVSSLYAHTKWHGPAGPSWHRGSKNII